MLTGNAAEWRQLLHAKVAAQAKPSLVIQKNECTVMGHRHGLNSKSPRIYKAADSPGALQGVFVPTPASGGEVCSCIKYDGRVLWKLTYPDSYSSMINQFSSSKPVLCNDGFTRQLIMSFHPTVLSRANPTHYLT